MGGWAQPVFQTAFRTRKALLRNNIGGDRMKFYKVAVQCGPMRSPIAQR